MIEREEDEFTEEAFYNLQPGDRLILTGTENQYSQLWQFGSMSPSPEDIIEIVFIEPEGHSEYLHFKFIKRQKHPIKAREYYIPRKSGWFNIPYKHPWELLDWAP